MVRYERYTVNRTNQIMAVCGVSNKNRKMRTLNLDECATAQEPRCANVERRNLKISMTRGESGERRRVGGGGGAQQQQGVQGVAALGARQALGLTRHDEQAGAQLLHLDAAALQRRLQLAGAALRRHQLEAEDGARAAAPLARIQVEQLLARLRNGWWGAVGAVAVHARPAHLLVARARRDRRRLGHAGRRVCTAASASAQLDGMTHHEQSATSRGGPAEAR